MFFELTSMKVCESVGQTSVSPLDLISMTSGVCPLTITLYFTTITACQSDDCLTSPVCTLCCADTQLFVCNMLNQDHKHR